MGCEQKYQKKNALKKLSDMRIVTKGHDKDTGNISMGKGNNFSVQYGRYRRVDDVPEDSEIIMIKDEK